MIFIIIVAWLIYTATCCLIGSRVIGHTTEETVWDCILLAAIIPGILPVILVFALIDKIWK